MISTLASLGQRPICEEEKVLFCHLRARPSPEWRGSGTKSSPAGTLGEAAAPALDPHWPGHAPPEEGRREKPAVPWKLLSFLCPGIWGIGGLQGLDLSCFLPGTPAFTRKGGGRVRVLGLPKQRTPNWEV